MAIYINNIYRPIGSDDRPDDGIGGAGLETPLDDTAKIDSYFHSLG